ncbi:conserved hypothetical transmembrane protein [Methylobacterium sp. 4-46]|uniref:hypothetical protein n=1 Tax=unclassified Methylobacterium TaxID=2615210 RepID=UPI000165CA79|nr:MULTISPECIES: hypothetical protein [Methylobacterium]ACA18585.1 conserved hypothetical transmembrane protein [Methylobacterium sp. 4-46]WFT77867.1 hypothetical protein QA634_21485 [Methylobacterium nodulans]
MLVSADEIGRSLRGTAELLDRHPGALRRFDLSERGFWRSFGAMALTAPAAVVALALERGPVDLARAPLLRPDHVTLAVMGGVVACFLAVPLGMIVPARRLGLTALYVPFVVVTNWILVLAFLVLSLPALLLALGLSTPGLATLQSGAFAVILLRLHATAVRLTLGLTGPAAALTSLACAAAVAAVASGAHALI